MVLCLKCPCCGSFECPICTYWNDDEVMDKLFSMNGSKLYKHFDAQWLEILTHYFVYSGKVKTTLHELYADLKRNGLIPISLEGCIASLENKGYITIDRKESNEGVFSILKRFLYGEKIPNDATICCGYLLKPAAYYVANELPERMDCSFFLVNVRSTTERILKDNPEIESDLGTSLVSLHDAACEVIPEKYFQYSDFNNQGKLLLRHMQSNQEYHFAKYFDQNGFGSFITQDDLSLLVVDGAKNGEIHCSRLRIIMMITRQQKKANGLEELSLRKELEAKELVRKGERDQAISVLKDSKRLRKDKMTIVREISSLREKLSTLDNLLEVHSLQNVHSAMNDVFKKNPINAGRIEELVDDIQQLQDEVKEANDAVLQWNNSNSDNEGEQNEMMQELDAAVRSEQLPTAPMKQPILEYFIC